MHRSLALHALATAFALSACSRLKAERNVPDTDVTPPSVPQNVAAVAPSPSRVSLSWSASTDSGTGVGGYQVFRDGAEVATVNAPAVAFEDASVVATTSYVYTVRAFDRATPPNVSAASAPAGVTTPTPTSTPGLDSRPSNTTCLAPTRPAPPGAIQFNRVFPGLSFSAPVAMLQAPGDPSRWFVVEQGGVVRVFANTPGVTTSAVFIDLTSRIESGGELGLLGMAFHPDWPATKEVFLSFTGPKGGTPDASIPPTPTTTTLRSVVSRFTTVGGGTAALDPASEQVILQVVQPYTNHNGGNIAFGPSDGYLYLGLGDGGSGGDPQNRAQTLTTLLGKFIRIDVVGTGAGYAIPADNPYAGNPVCAFGGNPTQPCPEIFAFGLRNPWRWSFDHDPPHTLWVGDVGQDSFEEVDRIEKGMNYGWHLREGTHCYSPSSGCPTPGTLQNGAPIVDPEVDYPHSEGNVTTGGYVYRGTAMPAYRGIYFFADFGSGRTWVHQPGVLGDRTQVATAPGNVSSFGEGLDGELYAVEYGGGLYQLGLAGAPPPDTIPASLADTGCVDAADPTQPAAGLVPYRLNAPFWSDGAVKDRWMALPDGQTISIGADGDWDFPAGTVLVKFFRVGGNLVETRLLMRHPDGVWAGYTYEWNDAQTAATRVQGGKAKPVGGQTWLYPSEQQCLQCHTAVAGRSLGLETAQENGDLTYPATGRTANQLATLEAIGLLSLPDVPANLPAYPDPLGSAPLEARARAYLHENCSQCHRPGGPTPVGMDFRFSTPLASTNACGVAPAEGDLGIAGAKIIAPGSPATSIVIERMKRLDLHRMPPLASQVVDQSGVQVVSDWIQSLAACP